MKLKMEKGKKLKKITIILLPIVLLIMISIIIINKRYDIIEKYSVTALRYLVLLLTIISGASFFGYILNKKIDKTISISIISISIILYVFGLVGLLKFGVYFVLVLYNVLGIYVFVKSFIKKRLKEYFAMMVSVGSIIFIMLFIILAITTFKKMFTVWDEYIYWSIASKNMFYLDDFVTNINSTLVFSDPYPPNPTILQYFFCKVIGVYNQGIEIFTINMIGFSLLISVFKNLKSKNIVAMVASLFCIIAIPNIFCDEAFYITIYVDALLGIIIGVLSFEYFSEEYSLFKIFEMISMSILLATIKPTGIIILLILVFTFGLYYIINKIFKYKNEKVKKIKLIVKEILMDREFLLIIGMILIGTLFWGSWKLYTRDYVKIHINDSESYISYDGNPITYVIKVFVNAFLIGKSESENLNSDIQSLNNMATHFFNKAYYSKMPVNMTATLWISLTIISMIILYKLIISIKEKNKFLFFSICMAIGELLYILFLQIAYMLVFANYEGIAHNSLQRYFGSYLMGMLIYTVFNFINYMNVNKIKFSLSKFAIVSCIILIFTPLAQISAATITAGAYNINKKSELDNDIKVSKYVLSVISEDSTVYPVHQTGDQDTFGLRFRYFMTPVKTAQIIKFNEKTIENKLSLDNWKKILYEEYDYVYVLNSDEFFEKNYNCVFEDKIIKAWTLYRIEKSNGVEDLKLIQIDEQ